MKSEKDSREREILSSERKKTFRPHMRGEKKHKKDKERKQKEKPGTYRRKVRNEIKREYKGEMPSFFTRQQDG